MDAGREGKAGLGLQAAELGQHVGEILAIDAADLLQGREILPCHEMEMGEKGLHGRIEPITFLELDREAFGEVACADAGRLEGLDQAERSFDLRRRDLEAGRDLRQVLGEISGLVEIVDQVLADAAKPGIGSGEIELCLQMVGKARRLGEHRLHFRLELAVAGAGRLPGGGRHSLAARRRRARHHPRTCSLRLLLRAQEIGEARNGRVGRGFALLQERIALELGLHIGRKLRMRKLQQLDRLHELGSHRQGLALAQLQPLHRTHEPTRIV